MDEPVVQYLARSERNDIDGLMETLSDEPSLVSPLSGRMVFRGRDDLKILLRGVYGILRDLKWSAPVGDERTQVAVADAKVGPFRLGDAMVFELAPDGRIEVIRPHLRPWLAVTFFALLLGPRVGIHPGVMLRALRG
jgi:hypothetical protein